MEFGSNERNNIATNLNKSRIKDRSIDELIGICKGILFDGEVNSQEAYNLLVWLHANPIVADDWFGRELYNSLIQYLEDGSIDSNEEARLIDMLLNLTGDAVVNTNGMNAATTLPLCENPPTEITLAGFHFALTGNFTHIKRKDLEKLITEKGGFIKKNANSKCHYLIIGEVGSDAWVHSSFGRKIEEAANLRDAGHNISIITEKHFLNCIDHTNKI